MPKPSKKAKTDSNDKKSTLANLFLNNLRASNEPEAMEALDKLVALMGVEEFKAFPFFFWLSFDEGYQVKCTPLYYAAWQNLPNLLQKLIEYGADINAPLFDVPEKAKHLQHFTPLMIATHLGFLNCVDILLRHGANILQQNGQGKTVLMLSESVEIAQLILNKAREQNILSKLLLMKKVNQDSAFEEACKTGRPAIVTLLLDAVEDLTLIDVNSVLHQARAAYWTNSDKQQAFEAICQRLRPHQKITEVFPNISKAQHSSSILGSYFHLFNDYQARLKGQSKEGALKIALAEFYHLLHRTKACLYYLQDHEEAFSQFYRKNYHETIPQLDETTYSFEAIDGMLLPIPKANYEGIKKHSALQAYLLTVLRQYPDLAKEVVQWLGYIPHKQSKQNIYHGDFFTDNRMTAVLHGKLSHQLQFLILTEAIKRNKLTLDYTDNGEAKTLTIHDLLTGLMDIKDSESKFSLWLTVMDARIKNKVIFCDPNRLNEVIMRAGKEFDLPTFSTFLIDSFCKGFIQCHQAYTSIEPFKNIGRTEFLATLNDMKSELFSLPKHVVNYAIEDCLKKNKDFITVEKGQHAIIDKSSSSPSLR